MRSANSIVSDAARQRKRLGNGAAPHSSGAAPCYGARLRICWTLLLLGLIAPPCACADDQLILHSVVRGGTPTDTGKAITALFAITPVRLAHVAEELGVPLHKAYARLRAWCEELAEDAAVRARIAERFEELRSPYLRAYWAIALWRRGEATPAALETVRASLELYHCADRLLDGGTYAVLGAVYFHPFMPHHADYPYARIRFGPHLLALAAMTDRDWKRFFAQFLPPQDSELAAGRPRDVSYLALTCAAQAAFAAHPRRVAMAARAAASHELRHLYIGMLATIGHVDAAVRIFGPRYILEVPHDATGLHHTRWKLLRWYASEGPGTCVDGDVGESAAGSLSGVMHAIGRTPCPGYAAVRQLLQAGAARRYAKEHLMCIADDSVRACVLAALLREEPKLVPWWWRRWLLWAIRSGHPAVESLYTLPVETRKALIGTLNTLSESGTVPVPVLLAGMARAGTAWSGGAKAGRHWRFRSNLAPWADYIVRMSPESLTQLAKEWGVSAETAADELATAVVFLLGVDGFVYRRLGDVEFTTLRGRVARKVRDRLRFSPYPALRARFLAATRCGPSGNPRSDGAGAEKPRLGMHPSPTAATEPHRQWLLDLAAAAASNRPHPIVPTTLAQVLAIGEEDIDWCQKVTGVPAALLMQALQRAVSDAACVYELRARAAGSLRQIRHPRIRAWWTYYAWTRGPVTADVVAFVQTAYYLVQELRRISPEQTGPVAIASMLALPWEDGHIAFSALPMRQWGAWKGVLRTDSAHWTEFERLWRAHETATGTTPLPEEIVRAVALASRSLPEAPRALDTTVRAYVAAVALLEGVATPSDIDTLRQASEDQRLSRQLSTELRSGWTEVRYRLQILARARTQRTSDEEAPQLWRHLVETEWWSPQKAERFAAWAERTLPRDVTTVAYSLAMLPRRDRYSSPPVLPRRRLLELAMGLNAVLSWSDGDTQRLARDVACPLPWLEGRLQDYCWYLATSHPFVATFLESRLSHARSDLVRTALSLALYKQWESGDAATTLRRSLKTAQRRPLLRKIMSPLSEDALSFALETYEHDPSR